MLILGKVKCGNSTLPRLTMITAGPVAFGDVGPSVQELKKLGSEDPSYTTSRDVSIPCDVIAQDPGAAIRVAPVGGDFL